MNQKQTLLQDIKMLIYRQKEGEKLFWGLNWRSDEMTFFSIKLVFPFFISYYKNYNDFDTDNFYRGLRAKVIFLSFRIRRRKNFLAKTKIFIWHCSFGTKAFGKQQLVATRESLLDAMQQDVKSCQ